MTEQQKEIVKALADCDMKVQKVARRMNYNRGTIAYHLQKIKKET